MDLKKGLVFLMLALLALPSINIFSYSEPLTVDTENGCELASDILTLVEHAERLIEEIQNLLDT